MRNIRKKISAALLALLLCFAIALSVPAAVILASAEDYDPAQTLEALKAYAPDQTNLLDDIISRLGSYRDLYTSEEAQQAAAKCKEELQLLQTLNTQERKIQSYADLFAEAEMNTLLAELTACREAIGSPVRKLYDCSPIDMQDTRDRNYPAAELPENYSQHLNTIVSTLAVLRSVIEARDAASDTNLAAFYSAEAEDLKAALLAYAQDPSTQIPGSADWENSRFLAADEALEERTTSLESQMEAANGENVASLQNLQLWLYALAAAVLLVLLIAVIALIAAAGKVGRKKYNAREATREEQWQHMGSDIRVNADSLTQANGDIKNLAQRLDELNAEKDRVSKELEALRREIAEGKQAAAAVFQEDVQAAPAAAAPEKARPVPTETRMKYKGEISDRYMEAAPDGAFRLYSNNTLVPENTKGKNTLEGWKKIGYFYLYDIEACGYRIQENETFLNKDYYYFDKIECAPEVQEKDANYVVARKGTLKLKKN